MEDAICSKLFCEENDIARTSSNRLNVISDELGVCEGTVVTYPGLGSMVKVR